MYWKFHNHIWSSAGINIRTTSIFDMCGDLPSASNFLDLIMFADETNLFFSYKNLKVLFSTVNDELDHIRKWFNANIISLNTDKTKFTLFDTLSWKDDIVLRLQVLKIGNAEIERASSIKCLWVLLDEHVTWNNHIHLLESKFS